MKTEKIRRICWRGAECIGLACRDLAADFARTGTPQPETEQTLCVQPGTVSVGTAEDAAFVQAVRPYFAQLPAAAEAYALCILPDRILVLGADKRGALWGVYRISRMLGVPEAVRFLTAPVQPCSELEEGVYTDCPQLRFRGWFINDEDLLCRWHDSGGFRHMDYPCYHSIADVSSMEPIVETALRMGINLMIPGSFIDIDDPYQEALVALCVRRGLYVSQHHVEPLGVSHFTWPDYWLRRGCAQEELPVFSFASQREKAVECWRHYVQKWAKYGDVVWQLGLRGKADRPVWENDSTGASRAQWGAVISDAVRTQYEIVREFAGKDAVTGFTLWMEGSALYREGLLTLPEDTLLIYSDTGPTQMLSADFYTVPHTGRDAGLYYHVAYWGDGPHLAMGTDLRKMLFNYRLVTEAGGTVYSILNVSNVREHLPVIAANARIVWDISRYDPDTFLKEWCAACYGCAEAADLFPAYFAAFIEADAAYLDTMYGAHFDFHLCDTPFPCYPLNDGAVRLIGLAALNGDAACVRWIEPLRRSIRRFEAVAAAGDALAANADLAWFLFGARYMAYLSRWALHCCLAVQGDADGCANAAAVLQEYLCAREAFAAGPFENWYRSDEKINAPELLALTRQAAAR